MHPSSNNFRTSLLATVLTVVTLFPGLHAQGSTDRTVQAEAKAPLALVGPRDEAGTFRLSDLETHALAIHSGSRSALSVTSSEVAFYGYEDCVRDCVGTATDHSWKTFCDYIC